MNKEIVPLCGMEMLHKIWLFERLAVKITHQSVDLDFLKRCRGNRIIPSFIMSNHRMRDKHIQIITSLVLHYLKDKLNAQ